MKVPVLRIAALTFRDAWRMLQVMPALLGIALTVDLVEAVITDKFSRDWALVRMATNLIGMLAAWALLTPILIAVQRFVLVGEVATAYRIDIHDPRFQKYFLYGAVLALLFHVGFIGDVVFGRSSGAAALFFLAAFIGYFVIAVKVALLFPAVAIDAPGTQWSIATQASRGNCWRIVGVYFAVMLPTVPILAISTVVQSARDAALVQNDLLNLSGGLVFGLVNFLTQLLWAVAMCHLFRCLEDKMRSGPATSDLPTARP